VDVLNTTLEKNGSASDDISANSMTECSNLTVQHKSWLKSIGISVACGAMKLIIKASMIRFETLVEIESCVKDIVDKIEEKATNETFQRSFEQPVQPQSSNVPESAIDSTSCHSGSFLVENCDRDNSHLEPDNDAVQAETERADAETSLRAVVEDIIVLAEEVIHMKIQEHQSADDLMADECAAWANYIDTEDIWGNAISW
jgi:hypothetical protein